MTITLNAETISLAKAILNSGFNGKIHPFKDCFLPNETVTSKHILYQQFVQATGCQIPKVFIYIAMHDILGLPTGIDENRDLGYHLRLREDIFLH